MIGARASGRGECSAGGGEGRERRDSDGSGDDEVEDEQEPTPREGAVRRRVMATCTTSKRTTAAKRAFSRWVTKERKKARREQDARGAAFRSTCWFLSMSFGVPTGATPLGATASHSRKRQAQDADASAPAAKRQAPDGCDATARAMALRAQLTARRQAASRLAHHTSTRYARHPRRSDASVRGMSGA